MKQQTQNLILETVLVATRDYMSRRSANMNFDPVKDADDYYEAQEIHRDQLDEIITNAVIGALRDPSSYGTEIVENFQYDDGLMKFAKEQAVLKLEGKGYDATTVGQNLINAIIAYVWSDQEQYI